MRGRRVLLVALAVLAVVLVVGGGVLLVADAHARTAAAVRLVDELDEVYESEDGYVAGPGGPRIRSVVTESIVNDGPIPELFTRSGDGYTEARYGAFGGVSYVPVQRPWSPRTIVAPIAAGAAIGITLVLIGAAGWRPRGARRRAPAS